MTYKRLTNNHYCEYDVEYDFCRGCEYFGEPCGCNRPNGTCDNYERFLETYSRLAELEDKIENGKLIELPCRVGDVVYFILDYVSFGKLEAEKTIRPKIIDYVDLYGFESDGLQVSWIDLNRQVFLSRAEAEKRLAELKNE